jgi:spore maturation protein CgeB
MTPSIRISFFGSSLVSAYWNGACTYYRGLIRALHDRGHRVTFYEPRAYERQEHRDIADPDWARVVIYEPSDPAAVLAVVDRARDCDVIAKTSGVGVYDDVLEAAVAARRDALRIFWDVDAPATLSAIESGR